MTYYLYAYKTKGGLVELRATVHDERTKALIHADWIERGFYVEVREEQ